MTEEHKMHNLYEDRRQGGKSSTVGIVERTGTVCTFALTQGGILETTKEEDPKEKLPHPGIDHLFNSSSSKLSSRKF